MSILISKTDQQLLTQHQINIEIDDALQCGIITFNNRRLKVSLLSRPNGSHGAWEQMTLDEEQMKQTAGKVALILLKKELLDHSAPGPLNFEITKEGVKFKPKKIFYKHEDADKEKDTREAFDAIQSYLIPAKPAIASDELYEDNLGSPLIPSRPLSMDFLDDDELDDEKASSPLPSQKHPVIQKNFRAPKRKKRNRKKKSSRVI